MAGCAACESCGHTRDQPPTLLRRPDETRQSGAPDLPVPSRRRRGVDVRRPALEIGGGASRRTESIALVQTLRVAAEERESAQALEIGMLENALHEPLGETTAAVW